MRQAYVLMTGFAAIFAIAEPARAQLTVNRLWVDLDVDRKPREDIVMRNESKERYYITVTPSEVKDPGTAGESRVTDPDPEKLGLLATPNRVILEPGSERSVRIVALGVAPTVDRVYRVRIAPQVGQLKVAPAGPGQHQIAIKWLTAYEILVDVRPPKPVVQVSVVRGPKSVTLRNAGNTNTLFFDGVICPAASLRGRDDPACRKLPAHRLYAGGEWTVPLNAADEKFYVQQRDDQDATPKAVVF